jgi:hypothetical protein
MLKSRGANGLSVHPDCRVGTEPDEEKAQAQAIGLTWVQAPNLDCRSLLKMKQRGELMKKNDETYTKLKAQDIQPENVRVEQND